jgi:hypothetical protein
MSRPSNTRPRRFLRTAFGLLLVLALPASSCRARGSEPTGGETHFLTRCVAADACGEALACACGVCTLGCSSDSDCSGLPRAVCFTERAPGDPSSCATSNGRCDVRCTSDGDCKFLSRAHRCESGFCRAGASDPDAGVGGSGGNVPDPGAAGAGSCERAALAGNQVVVLGDTFLAATHEITGEVEQLARDSGALAAGQRYRDVSTMTANALALTGHGILSQYQRAVEDAPVEVVIMDGGGADMLLGRCDQPTAECAVVADAGVAAQQLFAQMAADGVGNVVYIFYPDAGDAELRSRMDALRPLAQGACEGAPLPCTFLDLRPVFADHAEYLAVDGLNPSTAGARATAKVIWEAMQRACIAQ